MKTMKTFIYILLGLISVEINAQCWQSISAGNNHILAVKNDGTLWAWGSNNYGNVALHLKIIQIRQLKLVVKIIG